MPIYEYQCTHCGEKFEVRQPIGEDSSGLSCLKCHTGKPKRVFSSLFNASSGTTEPSETNCLTCSSGVCGLPPMG